jgi:hypothetical protein
MQWKAEQRDDAVDIDEQQRLVRDRAHAHSLAVTPTFIAGEAGSVLCRKPGDELKRSLRTAEDRREEQSAPAAGSGRPLIS